MIDNTNSNKIFTKQNTYVVAQVLCGMGIFCTMRVLMHSQHIQMSWLWSAFLGLYVCVSLYSTYKMLSECNKKDKIVIGITQVVTICRILVVILYKTKENTIHLLYVKTGTSILSLVWLIGCVAYYYLMLHRQHLNPTEFFSRHRYSLSHFFLLLSN